MIPKKIYQTWNTQQLPEKIEKLHSKMRKKNSTFEHIIYTDEQMNDYIGSNADKEIKDAYWKMNHIVAKADIWRYTILYNNGGIYFDIDSEIVGSLDNLINDEDDAIISPEINENLFIQWGLIFGKHHIILEKTLTNILDNVKNDINKFDHHSLTVKNYAKAIFDLAQENNYELRWKPPKQQEDRSHIIDNASFRIVGNDFNGTFLFKHKYNHLLRDRPRGTEVDTHWSRFKGPIF